MTSWGRHMKEPLSGQKEGELRRRGGKEEGWLSTVSA